MKMKFVVNMRSTSHKTGRTWSWFFQVGALVGVRKLLDFVFAQYELSYLDDLMPESTKRHKEDAKSKPRKSKIAPHEEVRKCLFLYGKIFRDMISLNHSL